MLDQPSQHYISSKPLIQRYELAVNMMVCGKPDRGDEKAFKHLTYRFDNLSLSNTEIANLIGLGRAICSQHSPPRNGANFIQSQFIGLDFDKLESEKQLLDNPFIRRYGSIIHHTVSSNRKEPRMRVIILLDEPIKSPAGMRFANLAVYWAVGLTADRSCADPCRFFYGNPATEPIVTPNYLPLETLREIYRRYSKSLAAARPPSWSATTTTRAGAQKPSKLILDSAGRNANGFRLICRERKWDDYREWVNTAAWAVSLSRCFGTNVFYNDFVEASRQHYKYNRDFDEHKLLIDFPKLRGCDLSFIGWNIGYDQKRNQVYVRG